MISTGVGATEKKKSEARGWRPMKRGGSPKEMIFEQTPKKQIKK